jgi:tetratricopeptide (TPR) repeat protein
MKLCLIICIAICSIGTGCVQSQGCADNINKLPMYGRVKKCREQIENDKEFLKDCDKTFKTRKEATSHMIMRGWQYLYSKKPDTSMMRFNQAWLLDSLNADIYWGFGDLLGMQGKFKESLPFFERSLKINAGNAKVWQDASTSYGNTFFQTKDVKFLNSCVFCLKKAVNLDPKNPHLYGQLTSAYSYFMQKDSALKYLKITEQLDPNAVNPEVKRLLIQK